MKFIMTDICPHEKPKDTIPHMWNDKLERELRKIRIFGRENVSCPGLNFIFSIAAIKR